MYARVSLKNEVIFSFSVHSSYQYLLLSPHPLNYDYLQCKFASIDGIIMVRSLITHSNVRLLIAANAFGMGLISKIKGTRFIEEYIQITGMWVMTETC